MLGKYKGSDERDELYSQGEFQLHDAWLNGCYHLHSERQKSYTRVFKAQ